MNCNICGIPITRTLAPPSTPRKDWLQDCRAIYALGWDVGNAKLSGVGIYAENDDILVPQDPSKRLNGSDQQVVINVEESNTGDFPEPADDTPHWGFCVHDACWGLLSEGFHVDINHLFLFYCSTYLSFHGLVNWSGDYGGAAEDDRSEDFVTWSPNWRERNGEMREPIPDLYKANPFQIPILRKAIAFSTQFQQDAFHSKLDPQKLSLDKDIFSHLPTEIAETIATLLPSPDVHSLRLASPVFATLTLSERFWVSRFYKGREFEYIPEVLHSQPTSCRTLYLSLRIWAEDNLAMSNRRRVWKLVDGLQSVLLQIRDKTCFGTASKSRIEPEAPDNFGQIAEGYSWATAERAIAPTSSDLRKLRYRSLSFPGPVQITQVSVSLFDTPDGPFVSGLSFIDLNGQVAHLGYCHPGNIVHFELPGAQCIQGFEVVHDCLGVRAIAVIAQDSTVSSFAGVNEDFPLNHDHPKKRMVTREGVSSLRAAFDAVKLVALGQATNEPLTSRTGYFWHSTVLDEEFLFDGAYGDLVPRESYNLVRTALFKHRGVDRTLKTIMCDNTDVCHVANLFFEFETEGSYSSEQLNNISPLATGSPPIQFADTGFQNLVMDIDGANGEAITALSVQMFASLVVGLKVHTNRGRTESLTSHDSPILNDPRYPWVTICPKGSKVVGMYMVGGGYAEALCADIGLISVQE